MKKGSNLKFKFIIINPYKNIQRKMESNKITSHKNKIRRKNYLPKILIVKKKIFNNRLFTN